MLVYANVLQPLIDFFEAILKFFHDTVGLGWGTSIIALTVVVRACLLPLTLKQFKSMQSLARHQPELKKLQDKYKGDRDRMNQEMMKFYKENKINPLSSCLPLLAQLPVFLGLFYMLQTDLRYDICPAVNAPGTPDPKPCGAGGAAEFFFIPDLTGRATGGVLILLILLYVGSQLLSTVLSSVSADKTQRYIMYGLPFLFVAFVWQFPAGLLVYWITTNLWTIVQQWIVRRRLGPLRPALAPGEEPPPSPFAELFKKKEPLATSRGGGNGKPPEGSTVRPPKGRTAAPPPAPPRKKKKRSGRRR
jgi:YidC/Oxa1 family membrane protein insertase